jgi:hypothetical protein
MHICQLSVLETQIEFYKIATEEETTFFRQFLLLSTNRRTTKRIFPSICRSSRNCFSQKEKVWEKTLFHLKASYEVLGLCGGNDLLFFL